MFQLQTDLSVVPFTILGKRTRVTKVIAIAGMVWGTAATCFAAAQSYPGAFAARFFVGLGGELCFPFKHEMC